MLALQGARDVEHQPSLSHAITTRANVRLVTNAVIQTG